MLRTLYRGLLYGGKLFLGGLFAEFDNPEPDVPDSTLCLTGGGGKTVALTGGGGKTLAMTGTGGSCR